jgi:ribonuclease-3
MDQSEQLQRRLQLQFGDPELLRTALTHRSKSKGNYERLEFLGDSVLGLIAAEYLYQRFPDITEGKLSRMRSTVVRRETLAEVARDIGLAEALILGEGELTSGGFNRDSILADSLEALIGAIYLDAGLDGAREFIFAQFVSHLSQLSPETVYKDPKSKLQEYLQGQGRDVPTYNIVAVSGEAHRQVFEVACHVDGEAVSFRARGTSRRSAEQAAAKQAYLALSGR